MKICAKMFAYIRCNQRNIYQLQSLIQIQKHSSIQMGKTTTLHNPNMTWMRTVSTNKNYKALVTPPEPQPSESPTLDELRIKLSKKMGVEPGYRPIPPDRSDLVEYLAKSQEELPQRAMRDSFIVAFIPLSKDKALQEKYVSFLGHVRIGRLLEDMDIFAVMVAHKHIVNPKLPLNVPSPETLVTALVDRIDFTEFEAKSNEDIKISGHVCWVGKTSMEVVVWLEQMDQGTWHRVTRAIFVIVARDPMNQNSAIVNQIEPADERERNILSGGDTRKQARIAIDQHHISRVVPSPAEQSIIHNIYLRTTELSNIMKGARVLPLNCAWMSEAKLSNTVFCHPENRNLHNTVFGGYLMRMASELSWVLAFMYGKYRPQLKSISDISFKRPIVINSLVQMHAQVVFTNLNYIQILVYAEIHNPSTGKSDVTNTFHYTFIFPEIVREIIPMSYHEAMLYVDGKRHFDNVRLNKTLKTG